MEAGMDTGSLRLEAGTDQSVWQNPVVQLLASSIHTSFQLLFFTQINELLF
jgi:hypothetical protein